MDEIETVLADCQLHERQEQPGVLHEAENRKKKEPAPLRATKGAHVVEWRMRRSKLQTTACKGQGFGMFLKPRRWGCLVPPVSRG